MNAQQHDLFAPFYRTALQARAWRRWALFLGGVVLVQTALVALLALQPPWVVIKDRIDAQPPVAQRMLADPAVNLAGVRLFFGEMAKLRFGWQSSTVLRDLEAFLRQCHPAHRAVQQRHLAAVPDADETAAIGDAQQLGGVVDGGKPAAVSRLRSWQGAGIVNHLVLPAASEDVHCRLRDKEPVWDCTMQATLVAVAQDTAVIQAQRAHVARPGTFVATFVEVPHSAKTPHGLLVAHLDWLDGVPRDVGGQEGKP